MKKAVKAKKKKVSDVTIPAEKRQAITEAAAELNEWVEQANDALMEMEATRDFLLDLLAEVGVPKDEVGELDPLLTEDIPVGFERAEEDLAEAVEEYLSDKAA